MSSISRVVSVDGLGLCEHCGLLLVMEDMAGEALNADWFCPSCKKIIGSATFGFEEVGGEPQRMKWVGPGGRWTEKRPEHDFELGNWYVEVS